MPCHQTVLERDVLEILYLLHSKLARHVRCSYEDHRVTGHVIKIPIHSRQKQFHDRLDDQGLILQDLVQEQAVPDVSHDRV